MRSIQARAKPSASRQRRWQALATMLAALVAIAVAAGWWSYGGATAPSRTASTTPPAASRDFSTVVIVSTPNKDTCHQYRLDGVTGALKDEVPDSCINSEDRGHGPGARLEAISRGFRDR
jgi:hypothetical protein